MFEVAFIHQYESSNTLNHGTLLPVMLSGWFKR